MARPKDPELERLWKHRLSRHSTSGLSIAEFCARAGIACSAFYYWKRRLAAEPCPVHPQPPLFVPLRVDGEPSGTGVVEIELPHQVRLRLDSPPEPEWLARVVVALAGLPSRETTR
jgi:hypothetical protein